MPLPRLDRMVRMVTLRCIRGELTMRLDKLTIKTREALVAAQDLAARTGQPEMLPEHVFLALAQQEGGLVAPLLKKVGADPQRIAGEVMQALDRLPKQQGGIEVGFSR